MTLAASPEISTRERLLDAALRVCARRGLHGATTREIADEAEVNEVTLFRHFGSKEKLIVALFQRSVSAQAESWSMPIRWRTISRATSAATRAASIAC